MRQQRPNDAGILVRQRHRRHIFVPSFHDPRQPATGMLGFTLGHPDHGPCPMNQQGTQIGIAPFADAEQGLRPTGSRTRSRSIFPRLKKGLPKRRRAHRLISTPNSISQAGWPSLSIPTAPRPESATAERMGMPKRPCGCRRFDRRAQHGSTSPFVSANASASNNSDTKVE